MANPSSQRGDEDLPGLEDSGHPVIVAKDLRAEKLEKAVANALK